MTLSLDLWQVISLLVTLVGAFFGIGKMLLGQFSRRIEERLGELSEESKNWRVLEIKLAEQRAHMSEHYVRREDYIRGQSVIEAKLDAVFTKMEQLKSRGEP